MGLLRESVRLHLVQSMDEASDFWRWAAQRRPGPLAVDTESGGLNPHTSELRLIQVGDTRDGWAFGPQWWGAACEVIQKYPGQIAFFNSPHDWRFLQLHAGVTPRWDRTDDLMLAGHLRNSLRPGGLKAQGDLLVDPECSAGEEILAKGMRENGWTWATVPVDYGPYWQYGALDTVITANLWEKIGREVTSAYRVPYELELATARCCAEMMTAGMLVDVPYVERSIAQLEEWAERAKAWLRSAHQITSPGAGGQIGRALERLGVPVLFWTAKTQQAQITKDTLRVYANTFPQAADLCNTLLHVRRAEKMVGSYFSNFLSMRDSADLIHAQIWTCQARTSRMSVTEPALQTLLRDTLMLHTGGDIGVRGAFIPPPGYVIGSIDADQIEARMGTHLSRDPGMLRMFQIADQGGPSFFRQMAGAIFRLRPEDVAKTDKRYTLSKNVTYGKIYGAGVPTMALTAGITEDEIRPVSEQFNALYGGLDALMRSTIDQGRANGRIHRGRPFIHTLLGRRLYGDPGSEYALLNYRIQGHAAEIAKRGVVDLAAAGFLPYMRLIVHDEILFYFPEKEAEQALKMAEEILTDRENYIVPITWQGSLLRDRWRKT